MPPRPVLKAKQSRPVSAVYIGPSGKGTTASPSLQDLSQSALAYSSLIDATPVGLPDLPEPPSPSSSVGSSVKSGGLPSPPATNSTGSGSTGDPATVTRRESTLRDREPRERERPLSLHSNGTSGTSSTESGNYHGVATPMRRSSSRSSSRHSMQREDASAQGDFDDDYDKFNNNNEDNDNESNLDDEDNTARLDRNKLVDHKSSSENVLALQRVKSLAQRNRMALDKLARLRSPSPVRSGTPNSLASSSSSRNNKQQPRPPPPDPARSGSETERESTRHSSSSSHSVLIRSSSSSHHHSPSLSSAYLPRTTTPPPPATPHHRIRQTSAPDSPSKARRQIAENAASSSSSNLTRSPSNRRRHRASMASVSQLQLTDFEEEEDLNENDPGQKTAVGTARERTRDRTLSERDIIIQSALAAAASSRQSPVGRRRGPLPKEFRSDLVDEGPTASGRRSGTLTRRDSPERDDRRDSWKHNVEPMTPFRATPNGVNRSSTVREARHRLSAGPGPQPSPRWPSDDFRSPNTVRDRAFHNPNSNPNEDGNAHLKRERRQSLRGGSMESTLMWSPGGRSLLGEGLRAAGLSRRKDEELGPSPRGVGGPSNHAGSVDLFRERERRVEWSPQDVLDDGRRRVLEKQPIRAATSMAHYQYLDQDDDSPGRTQPGLRGHKSAYSLAAPRDHQQDSSFQLPTTATRRERESLRESLNLERDRDRAGSSLSRYNTITTTTSTSTNQYLNNGDTHLSSPALRATHLLERSSTASPFGSTRRYSAQPNLSLSTSSANTNATATGAPEHTRLMLESLAMFETQINKIPGLATSVSSAGTGASQTDLARSAQSVVFAAERLSLMMKNGGARAMEASVEAEVELTSSTGSTKSKTPGTQTPTEVWAKVSQDYRESSRAADELVRGVTALLLGMGRVVRDFGGSIAGSSEFGSPMVHARGLSLDEQQQHAGSGSGSGRMDGNASASSQSGRRSVASRRSWEPTPQDRERDMDRERQPDRERDGMRDRERDWDRERDREDALRRLAGAGAVRSESVLARASPATFQKLRDRERERVETPPPIYSSVRHSVPGPSTGALGSGTGSTRKLFTPREQREQLLDAKAVQAQVAAASSNSAATTSSGKGVIRGHTRMATLDSQETLHAQRYEPSPTPASRTRPLPAPTTTPLNSSLNPDNLRPPERTTPRTTARTLTPLTIPKPLPTLPSETTRRPSTADNEKPRTGTTSIRDRDRDRRRATVTTRGENLSSSSSNQRPSFPSITTPTTATTATTTTTATSRSQVTFSRPSTASVSATLTDLQERSRTFSSSIATDQDPESSPSLSRSGLPSQGQAETARDVNVTRRRTLGTGAKTARGSLDNQRDRGEMRDDELLPRVPSLPSTNPGTTVHAADRSAAVILQQGTHGTINGGVNGKGVGGASGVGTSGAGRRERRRTVTDIWPRE